MEHKYEKIVSILSTASLWNIFSFKYLASAVRDESKKKKKYGYLGPETKF